MNPRENLSQAFAAAMNEARIAPRTTWPWLTLAGMVLLADQLSKALVASSLMLGERIPLTNFFNLVYVLNPGAAFSFLADAGGWQRYAFSVLGIAVSIWMTREILQGKARRMECFAYAMIIGGALGNVVDRVLRGEVTDFLDFHWQGTRPWWLAQSRFPWAPTQLMRTKPWSPKPPPARLPRKCPP